MANFNEISSICVDLEFKDRRACLDDLSGCTHGRHAVRFEEEEAVRTHAVVVTSDMEEHNAEY